MDPIKKETYTLGEASHTKVEIGDATFTVSLNTDAVDDFIDRLERALAAFKQEWNRKAEL